MTLAFFHAEASLQRLYIKCVRNTAACCNENSRCRLITVKFLFSACAAIVCGSLVVLVIAIPQLSRYTCVAK